LRFGRHYIAEATMTAYSEWLRIGLLCLVAIDGSAGSAASAQTSPAGTVKIITQIGAGLGPDVALRIVAEQLSQMWGQQALVVNQPGAGGLLAARSAAAAPPDGKTLFMGVASTFVALPAMQAKLPFNVNEFVPVGFIGEVPMAIAASPTLAADSLPDLIALSKKQSGGLSVAVTTRGEIPHLSAELLGLRTPAQLTPVFYPAMSQGVSDAISGRVDFAMDGVGGPIARGQLKLLAVASHTRMASRPNVPTVSETVPGFVATGWWVLMAPPGTPARIAEKLSADLRTVLARPDVIERLEQLGASTRVMTTHELAAFIQTEQQLWKPVIRQAGLAAQ
jgi:tripartite-type tricarboxylate transporter receptor subunit TctC